MATIKAIITTLDNLPLLKESARVLRQDELINEIVVVNNGSLDGTAEWLAEQDDLTVINRENRGAGPGRNAGLDAAEPFDFVLMLDGGIRPLIGGTQRLLEYLHRAPECDVIGVEIPHFETDKEKAWRRWPEPIGEWGACVYRNTRLSQTAYCLCRARAWDGFRFCEEGPFGEPGWGADDDEMAYQWMEAGIMVHVVTKIHPYRRASGSFRRLYKETGIWPNQYGSVYEKRVVWLQQKWPQYEPATMKGEPWLTVVVPVIDLPDTAKLIKAAHDKLRQRRFDAPWERHWNPYHIIAWDFDSRKDFGDWARWTHLRHHHGNCITVNGTILRRSEVTEPTWTGDFVWYQGDDWRSQVRPNAGFYALVRNLAELEAAADCYNEVWPDRAKPPDVKREQLVWH